LKGKWSLGEDKASTPLYRYYLPFTVTPHHSPNWYNLHPYLYVPLGRESKGTQKTPFLAINAKGGENISLKQKDRTTTNFQNFHMFIFKIFFNWYLDIFHIGKTLLNAKRRISSRGSFVLVKGKTIEMGGENFKS
jgi:hypothetical protein